MRQRITLFHRNEHGIDPADLKIGDHSLVGPHLTAVREHRVTLALDELPAELQELLRDTHELHIRWSSLRSHEYLGPWASRLPPGLHVFYTPSKGDVAKSGKLCAQLRVTFGDIDCSSPDESFTELPHDRFSHSTAYQYFQSMDSISPFLTYTEQYACTPADSRCRAWVEGLSNAVSVDFSYDTISHVVKVTALWPEGRHALDFDSRLGHRTEIGILTPDTPPHLEPHELGVTGLLTVLREDKQPSPVLFSFPSRHQDMRYGFSSAILQPQGLHPSLQIKLDSARPPLENAHCAPHTYLTLPRTIFADKYQLDDELFLASKNITALRYVSQPVDLEAPDYAMKLWGSTILLELQPPSEQFDQPWTAEIPLHLRYLLPEAGGYKSINVPYPSVFWACAAEDGTKFPNNPFDRVNLGYDGLFGPRTLFWHVTPKSQNVDTPSHQVRVPVLDLDKSSWISAGTSAVVILGFAFVVMKLLSLYLRTGYGAKASAKQQEKKKQ
ncbi:PIG-X [Xylariaceae sp. FL0016]|nr:PIG-X [Xylariaceae sp. FL0016]